MTHFTATEPDDPWTRMLDYFQYHPSRWSRTPPVTYLQRLGYPMPTRTRLCCQFVLRDLAGARRPIHWSGAFYAWTVHEEQRGRTPMDRSQFMDCMFPLVTEGIVDLLSAHEMGQA